MTSQNAHQIIVDAHVHVHDCFNLDALLSAAVQNFNCCVSQHNSTAVLFFTEVTGKNYFQKLIADRDKAKLLSKEWSFQRTQENVSLYADNSLRQGIYLMAGRQIVTQENLEVLALITEQQFEDGEPLEITVQKILSAGSIPVIPWGVGKWIGQRGTFLQDFLATHHFPVLFLGDNGGRPIFWRSPPHFKQAQAKGWRVLPGTDPLPLASEASRPGSFGFTVTGTLSSKKPGQQMKQMLLNPETQLQPYGSLESPLRFLRNQIAIRFAH
ncbi:MAG: hypothetical protein ACFB4I_15560 [Cyanophyceae cyanobacterium]